MRAGLPGARPGAGVGGVDARPLAANGPGRRLARAVATTVALLALAVAAAQTCRVEVEPNDTPAEATPLGAARCLVGELDDAQDAFVWSVGAEDAATPWVVEIEGIPGHLTRLDLASVTFAPDGVAVTAADPVWAFGTVDGGLRASAPILLPEGPIHLGLSKSGGSGRYVVHLRSQRALARDHRDLDRLGSPTGAFAAFGPLDPAAPREIAWTIDADGAGVLWGIEGQVSLEGEATVTLEGPSGRIASAPLSRDGGTALAALGLPAGSYRLRIDGGAGTVVVRTVQQGRLVDGREVEPNDDRGSANVMSLDAPFEGSAESVDWIAVDVPAARVAEAFDLVVEASGTITVTLFDAAGAMLQERSGVGGRLRGLVLGEGRRYLRIEGRGAIPYRLAFEPTAAPAAGHEVEPNDAFVVATPLGPDLTLRGRLEAQDVDVLSFVVEGEPGLWRVQVVGAGVTRLSSFDGGRNRQASVSGGNGLRLDNLVLAPGTHYLELRGEGDYAVRALRLGPAPSAPPASSAATAPEPLSPAPAGSALPADASADDPAARAATADPGPPPPAGWLESEPNDDAVGAELLAPGVTRVGTVPDGDRDHYRFTLEHDAYVRIEAVPPADGRLQFDTSGIQQRTIAFATGEPAVLERRLLAGAYGLVLRAAEPTMGYYQLRLTLLDPIALPADLEPNDRRESAVALPAELAVAGRVGEMSDDDFFALPVFPVDTEMTIDAELDGVALVLFSDALLDRDAEGRFRALLPAGRPAELRVRGPGTYRLAFAFATPPAADQLRPPAGAPGIEAAVVPATLEVAAYAAVGQVVRGEVTLQNVAPGTRTLTFESAASQLPVRIDLPDGLTLAAGERRTVPFEIRLPDDLRDDQPLRVTLAARSESGVATLPLTIDARCEVEPMAPVHYVPLPDALVGHLNVAWAPFGATVVDSDSNNDVYLTDGATSPGRGASREVGGAFVLDLPGNDPIRLTGVLLHPQARDVPEQLRHFAIDVSQDGASFEPVLEGRLEAARIEQAFAFDAPVRARFVRLRILDAQRSGYLDSTWVGEWQVLTDEHGVVGPIDLADPEFGGVMVWSDPFLPVNSVLTGDPAHARVDGRRIDEAVWVVGFQHGRAAQIARIEWVESERAAADARFERVRVDVSLAGPVGPWTELADWIPVRDAEGRAVLELDAPVWARYLRFTASGHDPTKSAVYTPEAIHVFERPSDATYATVLGAWGHNRASGPYEASLAPVAATTALADDGVRAGAGPGDDVREGARLVGDGEAVRGSVLVAEDEDWFRIDVPAGANLIELRLEAPIGSVRHALTDASGAPVQHEVEQGDDAVVLRAFVDPGSYFLHLDEPKRSVVFAWDTSGSVGPFRPITYASVGSFARDLDPEREVAQLLAFDDPLPRWLLPYWGGDPAYVTRYLAAFDRGSVASSAAETALLEAVRALGDREGTRAVLFITDHESGSGSYGETPELWRAIEAVGPRVFTFEISTGGSGITQDRMQAYAAANDGAYSFARDVGDFDVGFRRAACALRRPKAYLLTVAVRQEAPPGPGALRVEPGAGAADAQPAIEIVFDASGSMGTPLADGTPRIDAARRVLRELVGSVLAGGTPFALRAYGHVQPTTCDTRLEVPLAPLDRAAAGRAIDAIQPKLLSGTPLAASIEAVAADLGRATGPKSVLLITDGEESCGGDVEAAVRSLTADPDVRLSIVGFALGADVAAAAGERFRRLAEVGGGRYVEASDLAGLAVAVAAGLAPVELRFVVLDPAGGIVAEGVVGGESVALVGGRYRVRYDDPAATTVDVTIRAETLTRLVFDGAP